MSSDRLREFLDAHRVATPVAPPDEYSRILSRARDLETPFFRGRGRRGRLVAGAAVVFCSFVMTFSWIQKTSDSHSVGETRVQIAATPSPRERLDREVSDFFDETFRALDGDDGGWDWDEEILL